MLLECVHDVMVCSVMVCSVMVCSVMVPVVMVCSVGVVTGYSPVVISTTGKYRSADRIIAGLCLYTYSVI